MRRFSISSAILSEIFTQINRILMKLYRSKLNVVIMSHHVCILCFKFIMTWRVNVTYVG